MRQHKRLLGAEQFAHASVIPIGKRLVRLVGQACEELHHHGNMILGEMAFHFGLKAVFRVALAHIERAFLEKRRVFAQIGRLPRVYVRTARHHKQLVECDFHRVSVCRIIRLALA